MRDEEDSVAVVPAGEASWPAEWGLLVLVVMEGDGRGKKGVIVDMGQGRSAR